MAMREGAGEEAGRKRSIAPGSTEPGPNTSLEYRAKIGVQERSGQMVEDQGNAVGRI